MTAESITALSSLIAALTGLLWPIIAVGLLIAFREPATRALKRFSERGGSLEVFGLRVEVATEQQQVLIEDLQKQVTELRRAVGLDKLGPTPPPNPSDVFGFERRADSAGAELPEKYGDAAGGRTSVVANRAVKRSRHPRLLWVDDHPENNALLAASLTRRGFVIDQATTSAEALARHASGGYDAIITDMGRDGADGRTDAGVDLTRRIRAADSAIPILIFCSSAGVERESGAAIAAGADLITSSTTQLVGWLDRIKQE